MPRFYPTPLIEDCWSSIGNITFYHRNGICYWKKKPYSEFRGTPAQLIQSQIHHRAILAWQKLDHSVQLTWREIAKNVPSHRPPYDEKHHISGYNLFVSAYHGNAQLGHEIIPEPLPYPEFPSFSLEIKDIISATDSATIQCRLTIADIVNPKRWHLITKIQISLPGVGCNPGMMRNYLANQDNLSFVGRFNSYRDIKFIVPTCNLKVYQVHLRYRLIDSKTGYRNNWRKL
jgi:hypothetical protein